MRRRTALLLVLAVVVAVGAGRVRSGQDAAAPEARAVVSRVVDGDTVKITDGGRTDTVRLIGVDTPESVKPNTPVQCFAKKASAYTERVLSDRHVRLRFDVERRDRYDRLLAYVFRADDGAFVNADLVRAGYATVATFPPNVRYVDRFRALEREAREAGRGLWSACR